MSLVVFERVLTHYRLKFYNYIVEKRGEEIIFLTGKIVNKDGFHTQKKEALFKVVEIPRINILGFEFYRWPLSLLKKGNVIICVLSFVSISNLIYLFIARLRRAKFFWWGHTKNFSKSSKLERLKDSIKLGMIKSSDGFLAYTEKEEEYLRKKKGFQKTKIIALNNTLNSDYIAIVQRSVTAKSINKIREELNLKGNIVVGLIGRLHVLRNAELAIRAVLKISESRPNVRLLLIGDGPEYNRLVNIYFSKPQIIFVGAIEEERLLAPYMRNVDFFVNPGLVGLNLVHTMFYGKTTIVLDKSIHSPEIDYLLHGENGIIVDDNFNSFVSAIERLVDDAPLRVRLGKNAYNYAMDKLSIDNMVNNFLEVKQ